MTQDVTTPEKDKKEQRINYLQSYLEGMCTCTVCDYPAAASCCSASGNSIPSSPGGQTIIQALVIPHLDFATPLSLEPPHRQSDLCS